MQQHLHLLVFDRRRRSALFQAVDRLWMLPVVACSERARAPLVAARWLAARQLTGVVAGQWVGRVAAHGRSIDWLIAIAADPPLHSPPFRCGALECLGATRAVLDYQAWAVDHIAAAGGIRVSGPFGSLDWMDDARSWIESTGLTNLSGPTCFRGSANDVVLGLQSGSGAVYFKGAAADRAVELHAMAAIAQSFPESFPRTLALEKRLDSTRWLLEGCAGRPLGSTRSHDDAVRVASDIGCLQRKVAPGSLKPDTAPLILSEILRDADCLLERAGQPPLSGAAHRAFGDVMSLREGWTPLDIDPANVFVDLREIRYIDLEPRITALPMALSVFARRLGANGQLLRALRRAYGSTSVDDIPWQSVDVVSKIAEIVRGWQKVRRNVERGEVSGPLDGVERAVARRIASAQPIV